MRSEEWLDTKRKRDVPWMSDDQWECYLMAAQLFGGFHHMLDKPKPWGHGIKLAERCNWFSTYDFDHLTRLVFMAHDTCIRVEIVPSGPGLLGLTLFKRHKREGDISERHPTIEQALVGWRKNHPDPANASEALGLAYALEVVKSELKDERRRVRQLEVELARLKEVPA